MFTKFVEKQITWASGSPLALDENTLGLDLTPYAISIVMTGLNAGTTVTLSSRGVALGTFTGATGGKIDFLQSTTTAPYKGLALSADNNNSGDVEVYIQGMLK